MRSRPAGEPTCGGGGAPAATDTTLGGVAVRSRPTGEPTENGGRVATDHSRRGVTHPN